METKLFTVGLRSVLRLALIPPLLLGPCVLRAQEPEIDQLASKLAARLQKSREKLLKPKVVVLDFPLRPGRVNALGEVLADKLSAALAKSANTFQVVSREELRSYLRANLSSSLDLQDRDIAVWSARQVGAGFVVFGFVSPGDNTITLSVELIRSSDGEETGNLRATLPMTEAFKELLNKPLERPASPGSDVIVPCSAGRPEQNVDAFKAAGLSLPQCVYCPVPEYTREARKHKAQGTVKLNVVVDTDGRALVVYPVKGAPYGFIEQSVNAVRTWRFKPAMKDEKPVKACVTVETTFRLF